MARATSDHAFNATIWDVLVDPSYQVNRVLHEHGLTFLGATLGGQTWLCGYQGHTFRQKL